ncbi:MAG TPA: DUF6151 family protein [Pseudomonas sp.]|nr:DUF6151 family protein [Pseudomonas sp.]
MTHPISCNCGKLKGRLEQTQGVNRGLCYCADCQAFARFLNRDTDVLDQSGGTDVVQTVPKHLSFTEGLEHLACMRLSPNGLLRWYAACCNTPIGNTSANFKLSFVGLIHNCLATEAEAKAGALDQAFGPKRMQVNTASALGQPKPRSFGLLPAIPRIAGMLLKARLDGSYKRTPFFNPDSGTPIVTPRVLSLQEREALKSAV